MKHLYKEKFMGKFTLLLSILILMSAAVPAVMVNAEKKESVVEDHNLIEALAKYTGANPVDPLTKEDLEKIDFEMIDLRDKNIKNIEGLQYIKGVRYLDLSHNEIENISVLAEMKDLIELRIASNQVEDFTPLAEIKLLKSAKEENEKFILDISDNPVKDLDFLKNLNNIEELVLNRLAAADKSELYKLKDLKKLEMQSSGVEDLSLLAKLENLQSLELSYNRISDLSPLTKLKKLEYLGVDNNSIADLRPLAELPELKSVHATNQSIKLSSERGTVDNPLYNIDASKPAVLDTAQVRNKDDNRKIEILLSQGDMTVISPIEFAVEIPGMNNEIKDVEGNVIGFFSFSGELLGRNTPSSFSAEMPPDPHYVKDADDEDYSTEIYDIYGNQVKGEKASETAENADEEESESESAEESSKESETSAEESTVSEEKVTETTKSSELIEAEIARDDEAAARAFETAKLEKKVNGMNVLLWVLLVVVIALSAAVAILMKKIKKGEKN